MKTVSFIRTLIFILVSDAYFRGGREPMEASLMMHVQTGTDILLASDSFLLSSITKRPFLCMYQRF